MVAASISTVVSHLIQPNTATLSNFRLLLDDYIWMMCGALPGIVSSPHTSVVFFPELYMKRKQRAWIRFWLYGSMEKWIRYFRVDARQSVGRGVDVSEANQRQVGD